MAANEREIILKVWDKTEDVAAIVKDVATKGKHIQMCIDYLSLRKGIRNEDSQTWFYQQVENYVCRLLREKLVFKAENVVVNVKWDVKSFYYGFAFQSLDKTVTEAILSHLERKFQNPEEFQEEKTEYEFYYKVLKETEKNDRLFRTVKSEIQRVNLQNLYKEDELYRKKLIVRTYFGTRNNEFLDKLEKRITWIYIVEQKFYKEIILWLDTYLKVKQGFSDWEFISGIHENYLRWPIDEEMFNEAIEILLKPPELLKDSVTNQGVFFKPSEALRNAFAGHAIFFPDEKDNIQKILYRLFTTEAMNLHRTFVSNLHLNEFLIENEIYSLLLEKFVQIEDLEKISLQYPDKKDKLDLILALKSEDNLNSEKLKNTDSKDKPELESNSFYRCSKSVSKYLSTIDSKFYEKNPQVLLAECFLNCESFEDLIKSKEFDIIINIPYIQSLFQRTRITQLACQTTVEDLMKIFKNIDLDAISAEAGNEIVSFSNEALSSKYSQKFKLNFIYYIKQHRSAYAVYCLFIEQLLGYSQISKTQLFNSAEIATELAISYGYNDKDLVSHCVAFIEMLGFDSKKLRSYIRLLSIISSEDDNIKTSLYKITQAAEKVICESLMNKNFTTFPLRDYTAIWNVSTGFRKYSIPDIYLNSLANHNDWWKLLIFCQYFDIPLNHINSIVKSFTSNNIGMNFLRALSCETISVSEKTKRRTSFSRSEAKNKFRQKKKNTSHTTTSGETITASANSSNDNNPLFKQHNQAKFRHDSSDLDLFAIILLSSNNIPEEAITSYDQFLEILKDKNLYSTSVNLLKNSIHYKLPVLSILAATVANDNTVQWCWAIWLSVSSENFHLANESKNFQAYALKLIKKCVTGGYVATLNKSFHIFYENSKFCSLTEFLRKTYKLDFSEEAVSLLQLYLLDISNEDIELPFLNEPGFPRDSILLLTVKLLILHLQHNFNSLHHQQLYLDVICKSGISDISTYVDFCLLKYIFQILEYTNIEVNLETFLPDHKEREKIQEQEFERILSELEKANLFDKAIILAKLINYPIDNIIEHKWLYNFEINGDNFDISECEIETEENSLPTTILIHFYLYITSNIDITASKKYFLLKKALDVIKKHHLFPNEDFDRDRIEYDMISCYLSSDLKTDDIDLYYSEYFEKILVQERCVLYKSFLELKELAGVDDLTTSEKEGLPKEKSEKLDILLNKLLDDGDIVEALRLQAMFEHRTIDLHFIVFCMALAEGLTSIYNLSSSERMVLSDVVKSSISKFNRRTLGRVKTSHSSSSSSPTKHNESIDTCSTLEFEEIPPREKQDVLEALQGLASRLSHGINLGRRIVMVYRASMYLDKDYIDVLKTKDPHLLIRNAIDEDCLQKLVVISDIVTSTQMIQADIADFLASEIVIAIIRPRFYIFKTDQITFSPSLPSQIWGYDLEKEFHFILELSSNTTMLGNTLLDYCDVLKTYRKYQDHKNYENDIKENPQILNAFDSLRQIIKEYGLPEKHQNATQVLSHKKQNTINVELLIKAHECFVHECSMEGIANVLMRSKTLNSILSTAKSWNLIVRLLTGIGRYREMYYCFDALIKNEQFESLLGQFDEEKTKGLRQAIVSYVHDNCPQNQEYLKLTAVHFLMYKELAEMWETDANASIAKIFQEIKKPEQNLQKSSDGNLVITNLMLNCTSDLLSQLQHILENFTHAAENYLLDNKLRLASQSASNAELVAMQIDLVNRGMVSQTLHCVSVLHIKSSDEFRNLVNNELSVPQALILERAYPYNVNWVYSIFNQYVLQDKKEYLIDYCDQMELSDSMIENIVKSFQLSTPTTQKIESNMSNLVEMVESVSLKYKLSSVLGFKRIITNLINDQSLHYLKDTNYGRNEIYLIDK